MCWTLGVWDPQAPKGLVGGGWELTPVRVLVQMPPGVSLDPGCLGMGLLWDIGESILGEWGWEHVADACRCCTDKARVLFLSNLCVFRGASGMLMGQ